MDINLVWDSSVANAPSGFETAIEAAANYLGGLIANNITVNIDVGWGEDAGQAFTRGAEGQPYLYGPDALGGALAEGGPYIYGPGYSYSQLKTMLTENASTPTQQAAFASLPATDPTNGGTFYLAPAQAKVFGLMAANGTETDGAVGFSSTASWDYSTTDRAVPGEYDLVGAAEHELTHALGRMYGLGSLIGSGNYTELDLFRYTAPGTPELTYGQPSYFSINDGTQDLAPFDTSSDPGDWGTTPTPDSFDAYVGAGAANTITPADITVLNALGFDAVPCFLRGSRVLTPEGERVVERLAVGDRVVTAEGRTAPVIWIGERRIDCRSHLAAEKVWPVRIRAGAFAAGKPAGDLLLSPDHGVFCAGVLIPAQHLVNGATVVQEPRPEVHYLHLELDRHDILLAHGLEVESYLESGNRAQFTNSLTHSARPGVRPAPACAPSHTAGPDVVAARRHLLARAVALGWQAPPAPEIRLLAEGRLIAALAVDGARRRFLLPPNAAEIRILSATGVPAWLDPASEDRRKLGASIGAIWLDGEPVPLEGAALADGFYAVERNEGETWRWTDGAAALRLPPADRPRVLVLLVRDVMRTWRGSEPQAQPLAA
jgi:hypothetical protein